MFRNSFSKITRNAGFVLGAVGIVLLSSVEAANSDCEQSNSGMVSMHVEQVSLLNDAGKLISVLAHVADDNNERASGYQHICKEVIDETTILFVYPRPTNGRFHMRNVKAPLDIGFFDDKGRLIRTLRMNTYDDGNDKRYHPGQSFQYALEARVGFFDDFNLSQGKTRLIVYSLFDGK